MANVIALKSGTRAVRQAVGIDLGSFGPQALRAPPSTTTPIYARSRKEKRRKTPANVKEVPIPAIFSPCQMICDASIKAGVRQGVSRGFHPRI
jgi:hypothetical protein